MISSRLTIPLASFASLASLAVLASSVFSMQAGSTGSSQSSAHVATEQEETSRQAGRVKLVLAPTGNEARYRVRERLVGFELDNDAIGKTSRIEGTLVLEANGQIVKNESRFVVDLASLASDRSMRDNYVRNRTLQTSQYPTAIFVPDSAAGLPATLPAGRELQFQLMGALTLHGVTKRATWDVRGSMLGTGEFKGMATTSFQFADYNLTIPRVPLVASVVDKITLEYDLHLVPAPAG